MLLLLSGILSEQGVEGRWCSSRSRRSTLRQHSRYIKLLENLILISRRFSTSSLILDLTTMGKANQLYVPEGNRDAPAMRSEELAAEPTGVIPPPQYKANADAEKDAQLTGKEATLDVASERSLTFSTMMKGSAASRMTVFERKAALINAYVSLACLLEHC